jgi:hypothetical protein
MRKFFIVVALICLNISLEAQLNGTFTVYGAMPDYSNLQSALDDLAMQGIDGSVILNIRPGVYPDQITIDSIPGTSINNQVIIQSENNDSAQVRFNFMATGFGNDFVFKFNSCSWITLQNITVQPTGPAGFSTYTRAIQFETQSHHNTIKEVHFLGKPYVNALTVYSAQGNFCEYNTISFCHFKYGGTAISFRSDGSFSFPNGKGLKVQNSLFEDQQYGAITAINNDFIIIEDNIVINPEQGNNISAMYFSNIEMGGIIRNNKIYAKANKGIEVSNANNISGNRTFIYNNMISLTGDSYGYPLAITAPVTTSATNKSITVAYNSLATSNIGEKIALTLNKIDDADIRNNIMFIPGDGIPLFFQSNIGVEVTVSHNCLYSENGKLAQTNLGGEIYYAVSILEEQLTYIENTISVEPQFISTEDLHSTSTSLSNAGIPVETILTDIDGELRDEASPSIGADEIDGSPLSLNFKEELKVSVYPNPASNYLKILVDPSQTSSIKLLISDIQGKIVHRSLTSLKLIGGQVFTVPISSYPSGYYIYTIETDSGHINGKFSVVN